jgi:cytochrome c556
LEDNLHFRFCIAALLMACAGSMVLAQKVSTPEELDKAMKKVQPAMQAANKAVNSKAFPEAAKQLAIIKQVMDDSREFWIQHKKDDAIKANKEVVAKLEAAEKLLTAPAADGAAAAAAIKEIGGACRVCHETYRVRDADNNWVLKPGSIGG